MTSKAEQWLLDHTKGLHIRIEHGDAIYTSMLARINDRTYLLTAGHALEEIDSFRKRGIKIKEATILPTNGTEAIPLIDHLEQTDLYYIHEDDSADIGLIPLRPYYEAQLKGETFITETHYTGLPPHYTGCLLIGFPTQFERFETTFVNLNPAYVSVARTWRPSDLTETTPARFYGRVGVSENFDIKGMSGGPIMGFVHDPNEETLRYWIIALQSGWRRKRQLIMGTKLQQCIPLLLKK